MVIVSIIIIVIIIIISSITFIIMFIMIFLCKPLIPRHAQHIHQARRLRGSARGQIHTITIAITTTFTTNIVTITITITITTITTITTINTILFTQLCAILGLSTKRWGFWLCLRNELI